MRFPYIYKVLAHVPNKENGCKVIFSGCKCAKIGKTYIITQQPRFNLSFCKVEITICVNILEKQIIFKKKLQKTKLFCRNILQVREIVVPLHRNQETKGYISKTIQSYIIAFRSLIYLHVSVIMKRLLFAAVILFTDSANVR